MATVREFTGLVIAALVGFAAFALAGSLTTGFRNGPSSVEELRGLFVMAYWFLGPLVLISTTIAAPVVLFLRRRQLLKVWAAIAVFTLSSMVVTAVTLVVDAQSIVALLDDGLLWMVVTEHLLFGLAAGITYWAIAVLPSNNALLTDASGLQLRRTHGAAKRGR
jgi:hypothetical protein